MLHAIIEELLSKIFDESVQNQTLESLERRRELGNHKDLASWVGTLFGAVLSRSQSQTFIINKPLNMWFEEPSHSSAYLAACINITHGTEGTFAKNNGKFDLASKGLWFHGATHKGAESIRKSGISLIQQHQDRLWSRILPVA